MNRYLWLIIFIALFSDFGLWSLSGVPSCWLSRSLFYTLVALNVSSIASATAAFCSMGQFFVLTGIFGLDLLIMVPLALLYNYSFKMADISRFSLIIAVFAAVLLQRTLLEGYMVGIPLGRNDLFLAFLSSIAMVYLSAGSQGNRSSWYVLMRGKSGLQTKKVP